MIDKKKIIIYNQNNMSNFCSSFNNNFTDEQLCSLAQNGDRASEEILAETCSGLVKSCARPYFLAGADSEDLIQEGMIGLLKAIRSYDSGRGITFRAYARTCVLSRIYSAVRSASADKNQPLNHSENISEKSLFDESDNLSAHLLSPDPAALVIDMEQHKESIEKLSKQLSQFEKDVLSLFLQGLSYKSMSEQLGKPIKSVDNAVQRIRRKASLVFRGEYRK